MNIYENKPFNLLRNIFSNKKITYHKLNGDPMQLSNQNPVTVFKHYELNIYEYNYADVSV